MSAVVLNTCVLWQSLQRDFLLSLAIKGPYRPLWSSAILSELEEHEGRTLVSRGANQVGAERAAQYLIGQMSSAFDGACVEGGNRWTGHTAYQARTTSTWSPPLSSAGPARSSP
ncbi:PIN domain-containing protein [Oerskovia sp. NPDC060338]|uniref:PIN domain-containing protein n=1 Tax=Oerskovia sp. NPDC060338 TaxID=3347100 RepID=UPI003654FBBE